MQQFRLPLQIRWSDIDANFHLRHSVYYDWGALCRVGYLEQHGLTTSVMQQIGFGPILFREECVFKREIRLEDKVFVTLEIVKARRDFSRWTIRHLFYKEESTIAAILTIDGAWMDTTKRKLAPAPELGASVFSGMPLAEDFSWSD